MNFVSENPINFDEPLINQMKEITNENKVMLFLSSDDKKNVINSIIKSNENIKNYCCIEKVHEILEIINFMKNE
jgi:hypothetical protein